MKNKIIKNSIVFVFIALYFLVSTISMINSYDFFNLSHNNKMSWILAIGFELGAACSLASLVIMDRMKKGLVWSLFIVLTLFQMMSNTYHAFVNIENYKDWIELFGLTEEEPLFQKRIISLISGAILPLIALGFIKSLIDYLKPDESDNIKKDNIENKNTEEKINNREKQKIPTVDSNNIINKEINKDIKEKESKNKGKENDKIGENKKEENKLGEDKIEFTTKKPLRKISSLITPARKRKIRQQEKRKK